MPTLTPVLKKPTPDQLLAYDRDGFVVINDVFPPEELRRIDHEVDDILGSGGSAPHERHMMLRLGLRSGLMGQLAADPRILSLIEDIVTPGIAIYSSKMVAKIPGDATQICHWHQDDAYYTKNSQSRTRMSIWLGLHDSTANNGGVWFLPGSHKPGLRGHSRKDYGQCQLSIDPASAELLGAVCPRVPAGSMVLFSALTWHASFPNLSDALRRAFIVSYQEATVVGGNADQWKILRPA